MPLSQIKTSLIEQLNSLVLPAGVDVYYSNIEADVPNDSHLVVTVLPSTTLAVDQVSTDKEAGIFQVSVFVKKGKGEILSSDIAQVILDGFPRNLQLDGVRIEAPGSVASSFFDGGWQITPVSIPYINFC